MVSCILSPVLGLAYWVLMHWRFGQTLGKMVMKLKVTKRDRSAITLRQSLLRSCVDIAFYAFVIAGSLYALLSWPHDQWSTLSFWDRMGFFSQSLPDGNSFIQSLYFYWLLAELIVLLINRKRRALHDFIAGTVVISLRKPVNEPLN